MSESILDVGSAAAVPIEMTPAADAEWEAMGFYKRDARAGYQAVGIDPVPGRGLVPKRAISAPSVLNEASVYSPRPSSFSRGMRLELSDASLLLISGTASIDEAGATVHQGDFEAQCLRTFRNITQLLAEEDASWHDIVRTTCYLRDIERDYDAFNDVRTLFMRRIGLDPLPASTGIQARLCRSDLLVEIEAIAIIPRGSSG